jgi:hypothetical protein
MPCRVVAMPANTCHFHMQDAAELPPNLATEGIADAIALGAREGGGDGSAVLMVVQPGERNSYDQQASATLDCNTDMCMLQVCLAP